ncbi:short chain dehydrogenase/reductase family [Ophiobolus disseminans]|uniref:Short chain dehydrogenase/reductase family n=1 Tax=Ophiobolus disseminans TaxID=1469910 RepID=A0A6A7A3P6_9PLEO|nr:short chain dehydrogenase/reductase family [Ophiobolus disseminans]
MSNLDISNLFSVKDMVFVITGGGSGIGAMFAKALATNHASKVYILGRRLPALEATASTFPNTIIPIQCDITSKPSLSAAAARIAQASGFVNCVVANSGATGPVLSGLPKDRAPSLQEVQTYLWDTPMEDFTQAFEVNTTACFYTLVAFLGLLGKGNESGVARERGVKSQFVVTTSIGAFSRRPGMGFAYAASKMAVSFLGLWLAFLLTRLVISGSDWRLDIRANSFCPGVYPSDMSKGMMGENDITKEGSVSPDTVPLTRAGTEEDAGGALLFMCSRAGAYINGNVLISDGGRMSIVPATY